MTTLPPENPSNNQDPESVALIDSDAARRALDYYLNPAPADSKEEALLFTAREDLTLAQASIHTSALLRCAAATAYESADGLQGAQRDLAFSVMHMINLARAMVERMLNQHNA